jgi:hypothetical protein
MRRLKKPDLDPAAVYQACMDGVIEPGLVARFDASKAAFDALALQYDNFAAANQLYNFVASDYAKPQQLVFADLAKGELMDLYSKHMVGDKTAGRAYYDKLITRPPNGKCPYCCFGQVSTLDHFLAKSRYPGFAVLPANLVPSCTDCNKGKGSAVLVEAQQIPHPYFAEAAIEADAWLFAEILATSPATAKFSVQIPKGWPPDLGLRVTNYFEGLDLANRFAVEAASEIVSVGGMFKELSSPEMRKAVVVATAKSEREHRTNSWRAALYEALAASTWFVAEGYTVV